MEFKIRKRGRQTTVFLPAYLDSVEKSKQLRDTLSRLFEEGGRKIILNLDDTWNINSEAVGIIIKFFKSLKQHGGCLYITPPNEPVKELLETLMLDKIFEIYSESESAPDDDGILR